MKLCSIRSGSKGNAILVWTESTKLMIDCGISGKMAECGMKEAGVSPQELTAILVTHEHKDHTGGVGILSRRYDVPVFANIKTWNAMAPDLGKMKPEHRQCFEHTESFSVGDIEITPFSIPHDAADPVGYCLEGDGKKLAIATDIGVLEEELFRAIKGSRTVLLESNHDLNMLDMGSYPLPLKQRIRSNKGHLSNDDAGKAAEFLVRMGVRQILLGHLSPENNYPLLAEKTVENSLVAAGIQPGKDMVLGIAPRDRISRIFEV